MHWALPLAGLIAAPHTLEAENVEALGKDCIFLAGVTAGAGQPCLGRAKVSTQETVLTVPRSQADSKRWFTLRPPHSRLHLTLMITLAGRDKHFPHEETGRGAQVSTR